jgi:peptide/nickel transport system ATP-binding protein
VTSGESAPDVSGAIGGPDEAPGTAGGARGTTGGGLRIDDLHVTYRGHPPVRAVDGVSLTVAPGEVVGLVGESGCGKSTLARAVCGVVAPNSGSITFDGEPVRPLGLRRRPKGLTRIQMVFQDPFSSLHPRRRIGAQIGEGVRTAKARGETSAGPDEWLRRVGLEPSAARRFPHEFSGGQRQRIAIARALAAAPSLLVGDEPISALDASTQAMVAALMRDLTVAAGAGLLFISHDLSVVRLIADRLVVMYRGRVVESGHTDHVWSDPGHPYTQALLGAIPQPDGSGTLPEAPADDVSYPLEPVHH